MKSTREQWAARVAQWRDSGRSAAEFAAELGVRADTLKWWKWKLDADTRRKSLARRPARPVQIIAKDKMAVAPLTFVELTTAPMVREPLEVVLPSTLRVRVPIGFDDATLTRLLDVLDRR